jgi:tRNA threonylcarbamoyladenosine biosynthesis protein TsaB
MLILAADTSGKEGSIALAQCVAECRLLEIVPLMGGTFSAQLVPQIAALLQKHGFNKNDVGAFAVASGPGSFTGLRVGLAAIKALAEVLQKPIASVSLLQAVAESSKLEGNLLTALDAGRREIYAGEYQCFRDGSLPLVLSERLLTKEEFLIVAKDARVVTPDQSVADIVMAAGLRPHQIQRPRSDAIARLGWKKIQRGEIVTPEELDANYIRRSDAEIFAKTTDKR